MYIYAPLYILNIYSICRAVKSASLPLFGKCVSNSAPGERSLKLPRNPLKSGRKTLLPVLKRVLYKSEKCVDQLEGGIKIQKRIVYALSVFKSFWQSEKFF
jgi:hypothetical protein